MAKKKIATAQAALKQSVPVQKGNVQGSRHREGYVPLWKQWQQSEEFNKYKKNDMAKANEFVNSGDGLTTKEREELMAKQFQLRWVEAASGKVLESTHSSEKSAKDRARDLSLTNSPVQLGEVDGGKLLQQWNYNKGRQEAMDTKKRVTVAPISKQEASQLKTNEKGTTDMVKKSAKKGSEKPQKAPKVAAKAKTQPSATASGQPPKQTGTIRDQFGLREGSNREKLVDCLLEAKGKPVAIAGLLKAVYGSAKEEGKGPLNMVLKGTQDMIDKNKIKMEIVRAKDDKGVTIALKAK